MSTTQSPNGSGRTAVGPDIEREAKDRAANAGRAAADLAATARREAEDLYEEGKDRARRLVDDQREAGASKVHGVAEAARKAADDLERTSPDLARFTRDAAGMVDSVSESIRSTSVGGMLRRVEGFARREPLAFFGAALATGFAVTRFRGSSARHDHSDRPDNTGDRWSARDGSESHADDRPVGPLASGPENARHVGAGAVRPNVGTTSPAASPAAHPTVGSASHAATGGSGIGSSTATSPSNPRAGFSSSGAAGSVTQSGPASSVRPDPSADRPQSATRSTEAGKAIGGPSGPETTKS